MTSGSLHIQALLDARTRQLAGRADRQRAAAPVRQRRVLVLSANEAAGQEALYALPGEVCGPVLALRVTPLPAMQRVRGLCGLAVHDGGLYSVAWLPALILGTAVSDAGTVPPDGHMVLLRGLGRPLALAAPRVLAMQEAEDAVAGAEAAASWHGAGVLAHLRLADGRLAALLEPRHLLAPLLPHPAGRLATAASGA